MHDKEFRRQGYRKDIPIDIHQEVFEGSPDYRQA